MPSNPGTRSCVKSGLVISPGRMNTMLANAHYSRRKGGAVHVALAGSVEAILTLVIDRAAAKATAQKLSTLKREHIRDAIASDPGLRKFFQEFYVSDVPAVEYISPALIPGKLRTKKSKKATHKAKSESKNPKHKKVYA